MKSHSATYDSEITAPCRAIRGEFHSAIEDSYSTDYVKSISVEAAPDEGKFFGYSVCQKATVVLLRKANRAAYVKGSWFTVKIGTAAQLMQYPKFYVDSVEEDSKTGDITLVGYDIISKLNNYTWADLNVAPHINLTVNEIIALIANKLGITINNYGVNGGVSYNTSDTLNIADSALLRDVCNSIAEITGTILINLSSSSDTLTFTKLDNTSRLNITKSHYYDLEAGAATTLTKLISVNELNDGVSVGSDGVAQVFSNNPFLTKLPQTGTGTTATAILTIVFLAVAKTIYSYTLDWIANPALQFGDRVTMTTKNGTIVANYLGEKIEYTGGLKANSSFNFKQEQSTEASISNSIGTSIKRAEAKVDKVNGEIELKVSKDEVIASINLSSEPSSVKISADRIELSGYVTFTELENPQSQTFINGANIQTRTITAQEIATGTITTNELAANAITSAKISANAITSAKINANAVTTAKINSGAVTADKISAEAITADKIAANAITTGKISTEGLEADVIKGGTLYLGDGAFTVDSNGKLSCSGAEISGDNITATDGTNQSFMNATTVQSRVVKATNTLQINNSRVYSKTSGGTTTTYYLMAIPGPVTIGHTCTITLSCFSDSAHTTPINAPIAFTESSKIEFWNELSGKRIITKPWTITIPAGSQSSSITFSVPTTANVWSWGSYPYTFTESYAVTNTGFVPACSVIPYYSNNYDLGTTSYKWKDVYSVNGIVQTSDRNQKTNIAPIDSKYTDIFDNLQPVKYKLIDGHRTHLGLVAQDVAEAMTAAGVDSEDFACLVIDQDEEGNDIYNLRYTELISLLVKEVQTLKAKVTQLEGGNT